MPLFCPLDMTVFETTTPLEHPAQVAIMTETCCGGTQFCPVTVTDLPAAMLLAEIEMDGGLAASTVNGPPSWLLARVFVDASRLQIL